MESTIRSRKRKQRPSDSDAFGGIFTRSRSQIYFHRHRSGYARSDSNRVRNLIKSMKGTAKSVVKEQESEVMVDHVTSQGSVKDLRARRVFSPATVADDVVSIGEVDLEADLDLQKKNDAGFSDLEVSRSVAAVDLPARSENIVDSSSVRENDVLEADNSVAVQNIVDSSLVRENDVIEADDVVVVEMTPTIAESEENQTPKEKHEMISAATEIADNKVLMNKSQSSVASLRGRRKVFKSPTSFNYTRLLPYLMDSGNDDSSNIEIVEATLSKNLKPSNPVPNMVAPKDEEIGPAPVSSSRKLADDLLNNAKSLEKQFSNGVNAGLVSSVDSSDVVQKSQEDVNGTLDSEQMTPPDSNIYNKPKTDNVSGVPVKRTYKPALKSCSRMKLLETPTSYSHRRLLPFLMSVAEDYSCPLKDDQSSKPEMATEQNQQPPTQLLNQDEKPTTADETSNSPTSTLVPADTSVDRTQSVTLVSNDNVLDANGPDKEGTGSISQLEVNLHGEAVKLDSCIKMELSPPKINLKCVEEATFNATPLCAEQSFGEDYLKTVKDSPTSKATPPCIEQSSSEDHQKTVDESSTFKATPPCIQPSYSADQPKEATSNATPVCVVEQSSSEAYPKTVKDSPTSKATPPRIEQSSSEDHQKTVKESSTFKATPRCIEPSYSADQPKTVKESPYQYLLPVTETQGENIKIGILKRTPRGCRGICNCLNCTSFRLHAERSFEFSKNQMHDAEEVALELMNELSCLRNILETTSSYSNSLDNAKEKQVKEACAKALYKEQEARAHLAQMNEDLSIHCRSMNLVRPKVTFANKIEEKFISKDGIKGKKTV